MHTPVTAAPLAAIGLLSAATLAYEILLTRIFAIVHWHHLVAIAISLALLGYGASGTFLAFTSHRLRPHFPAAFVANALLFGLSTLVCTTLAQRLPFDPQALTWDGAQLFYLAAAFLILAVPFFAAANCIGLTLWYFKDQIPRVYGFDLIGAGLGAFGVLIVLALVHPASGLFGVFLCAMLVAVSAAWRLRWQPRRVAAAVVLTTIVVVVWARPTVQPAPYKDLAQAMSVYGAAVEEELGGVAGTVHLVRNDAVPVRYAPGLSLQTGALPPRQLAVFVDGDAAGTLADYRVGESATAYFRDLVSALPYVVRQPARVAVLNASTGERVQQALALGATTVTAVESNPELYQLSCGHYPHLGGRLCEPSHVTWQIQSARAFIAGSHAPFDLITLTADTDPAGLAALNIDFDLTTEAFRAYLAHLSPQGMLAIEGPTRVPPRLSMRMLDTARAALVADGVDAPAAQIAMIRGWQRFLLLVSRRPLAADEEATIRAFTAARGFDLVWLPGIRPDEPNRFQQLKAPQFFQQAAAILGAGVSAAQPPSRFRLTAATDDRPFPTLSTTWRDFWQTLARGDGGELAQLDAGLLIGVTILVLVSVAGIVLIALPLAWLRQEADAPARPGARLRTLGYFGLVGIAFLFLEIGWIQRLLLFLGHPVYATTAVLAAFLIFAGLGSLWSQRRGAAGGRRRLLLAVATILLFSLVYLMFLPGWLDRLAGLSIALRIAIVLLFLAPLAFAMGIPFPTGLRNLGDSSRHLIPWAWGINGCASVISAAAAPLLAAEIGLVGLMGVAVAAYLALPLIRFDTL
jgi:hypothetical protein